MKSFITIFISLTIASSMYLAPSYGAMREDRIREPFLWAEKSAPKANELATDKQEDLGTYSGEVRCTESDKEENTVHDDCDLELVRSDGEVFDIEDSPELAAAACKNHSRHLKVKIEAEKTPRFLFWGGNLKVKKYSVEGDEAAEFCLAAQNESSIEDSSSGKEAGLMRRGYL